MTTIMQFDTGHAPEDLIDTDTLAVGHVVTDVLGDAWVVLNVSYDDRNDAYVVDLRNEDHEHIEISVPKAERAVRRWHAVVWPGEDLYH